MPLLLMLACSPDQDPSLTAPRLDHAQVTVDGTLLRDSLDRQVLLRGFNAGGRSKMPPFAPFEFDGEPLGPDFNARGELFFSSVAALGANTVRLTFSWEALEPTRGQWNDAYLQQLRAMLEMCDAHDLKVILDFHQDVFASPFCGDGFPLWTLGDMDVPEPRYDCGSTNWGVQYFDAEGQVSQAFDRLWSNEDGIQDDMEAMWRHVVSELGDHPAIAGFETINEPGHGSTPTVDWDQQIWPAVQARMGAAIQEAAGAQVTVFAGGRPAFPGGAEPALLQPELDGFVFAPHYYDPAVFLSLPTFSEEGVAEALAGTLALADDWGVPALLGEFGGPNSSPPKTDYIGFVFDQLDARSAHGTAWDATMTETLWNGEDFSVFTADGAEQPWGDAFARGYPRAVAGALIDFGWDRETFDFELRYTQQGGELTEVSLPTRHLGEAPLIEVEGARYHWLPEQGLLLLSAETGAQVQLWVSPEE